MKKNKVCANCQYFREPAESGAPPYANYCSNSQSEYAMDYVLELDSCDQYTERDKKAPLWMRLLNKVMR